MTDDNERQFIKSKRRIRFLALGIIILILVIAVITILFVTGVITRANQ